MQISHENIQSQEAKVGERQGTASAQKPKEVCGFGELKVDSGDINRACENIRESIKMLAKNMLFL